MEKPSIIILHGWGLSGEKFTGLQHELASLGYRVFAPDLPGFGKSIVPSRPYYLSDYVDFYGYLCKNTRLFIRFS
jgi:pimeloyl-ACP methyl ester carboxylesterase